MLQLDALVLSDVELHPYHYEEKPGVGLRIDAKVELSSELNERLLNLLKTGGYFTVIRRGIQEAPREMRFGAVYWSAHGETTKYDIVLVERTPSDEAPSTPWDLEGRNARAYLAFEVALRKELFKLLEERGVLSADDISGLRERAFGEQWTIENEFSRVPDIDMIS
jgi:hypothetical protein